MNSNKSILFVLIYFLLLNNSFAIYNIGDTVTDFSYQETIWDESGIPTTTERSISEFIDSGIPVLLYFYEISYS